MTSTISKSGRIPSAAPPAVWAAFVKQGAWKSWALLLSFALNFLLGVAAIGFADKPPDVVLVDSTGKSTYVGRAVAGDALLRFLDQQRHQPSDLTVVHFTREFLSTLLAVNSSTIDAAWPEALAMMTQSLRDRMSKEASTQKLLETYRLAEVRTDLTFEDIVLVERRGDVFHVRATVARKKSALVDAAHATTDRLQVDLVERIVPRTPARPDGLEIAEYRNQVLEGLQAIGAGASP